MSSRIGVVELPGLASALAGAGFDVVSGENYRAAAVAIRGALDAGERLPVVVSDSRWPGQKSWSERVAATTPLAVVRLPEGSGLVVSGASLDLGLPLRLDDLLTSLGLTVPPPLTNALLMADGTLALPPRPPSADPAPPTYDEQQQPGLVYPSPLAQPDAHHADQQVAASPAPVSAAGPTHDDPWEEQIAARAAQSAPDAYAPTPTRPAYEPEPVYAPPAPEATPDPRQQVETYPQPPGQYAPEPVYPEPPVPTAPARQEPIYQPPTPSTPIYSNDGYPLPGPPAYEPEARYAPAPQRAVLPPTPAPSAFASPQQTGLAQVIVVGASKGGVGKTTTTISLAQRAAKMGLRVVLIDANFGQSDVSSYLRVDQVGLPSVLDVALSPERSLHAGLVGPDMLNQARPERLDPLQFALLAGPPPDQADPGLITPDVYYAAVEAARRIADLVVVDTQIVEAVDLSGGMVDQFLVSLLHEGAFFVGLTDVSPGIKNLCHRMRIFAADGIARGKILTFVNRAPDAEFNQKAIAATIAENSTFLGFIFADDTTVPMAMNQGLSVCDLPVFAPILDAILARVTGRGEAPLPTAARPQRGKPAAKRSQKKSRRGWFK